MTEQRRATRRRTTATRSWFSPTLVIGLVLVLVTGGALLLVRPHDPAERRAAPTRTTLDAASVGCPSGPTATAVGTGLEDAEGGVSVLRGAEESTTTVRAGEVTRVEGEGPVVLSAEGELAPGLLAARFGDRQVASLDCPAPSPETWFAGVGAGVRHEGVLELVNPDEGPAVADVTVHARTGPLDVPGLLGLTVNGRDSLRLPLGELVPRRSELALRVVVSRGRLAASLLDRVPELGSRPATEDWLAPQAAPTTRQVLLGLPVGDGTDQLALANPGDSEARVLIRFLTPDSAFAPEGIDEQRVPPGGVRTVSLSSAVRTAVEDEAIGLLVTADVPVLATLRTVVRDDLSHAAPVLPLGGPATALLPGGAGRLVLADAGGVGTATVQPFTAAGRALEEQVVELAPGRGAWVALPRGTALLRVVPERTTVHGAVLVTARGGATVVPLRERVAEALVPEVRPGLP